MRWGDQTDESYFAFETPAAFGKEAGFGLVA
jgi:hypothetical protein